MDCGWRRADGEGGGRIELWVGAGKSQLGCLSSCSDLVVGGNDATCVGVKCAF